MSSRLSLPPASLWVLAVASLVLLGFLVGVGYVWRKHQWATQTLADIEPRYARLLGLQHSADALVSAQRQLDDNLMQHAYGSAQSAEQIGPLILQRVRELATGSDLSVTSSQVLSSKEEGAFDRIGVDVRIDGAWPSVVTFLQALSSQQPALYADSIQVEGQRSGFGGGATHMVSLRMNLFALRVRP